MEIDFGFRMEIAEESQKVLELQHRIRVEVTLAQYVDDVRKLMGVYIMFLVSVPNLQRKCITGDMIRR